MKDNQISLYTGWDGNGTTAFYVFYREVGLQSSQWATAKTASIANGMRSGWSMDDLYKGIIGNIKQVSDDRIPLGNKLRGFSGWPYSIFYKQIDEDSDYYCKFILCE